MLESMERGSREASASNVTDQDLPLTVSNPYGHVQLTCTWQEMQLSDWVFKYEFAIYI